MVMKQNGETSETRWGHQAHRTWWAWGSRRMVKDWWSRAGQIWNGRVWMLRVNLACSLYHGQVPPLPWLQTDWLVKPVTFSPTLCSAGGMKNLSPFQLLNEFYDIKLNLFIKLLKYFSENKPNDLTNLVTPAFSTLFGSEGVLNKYLWSQWNWW